MFKKYRHVSWVWAGTVESHKLLADWALLESKSNADLSICLLPHQPAGVPGMDLFHRSGFMWVPGNAALRAVLCVCERALGWGETCSVPHSSGQPLELLGAGRVHRRVEARHHLYTRTWHDSIINHVPCQTFFCKTNHFTSLTCVQFFLTVLSNDKSALSILYCLYVSFILQH